MAAARARTLDWHVRCVVLLLAPVMGAAGCGGGEGDDRLTRREYQEAILEIAEDQSKALDLYGDVVVEPSLSRHECAGRVRALHQEVRGLIDRVASLEPPRNVAAIHERFVTAANTSLDRVSEVTDQVEAGEVACGQELNNRIYGLPSSKRAERAISELEAHGYYVYGE